jgi:hypothetical protein
VDYLAEGNVALVIALIKARVPHAIPTQG